MVLRVPVAQGNLCGDGEAAQKSSVSQLSFSSPSFLLCLRVQDKFAVSRSQARQGCTKNSETRGREPKEQKFLNIPEVIMGLKIVTFCMKGRKRRMKPVFLLVLFIKFVSFLPLA